MEDHPEVDFLGGIRQDLDTINDVLFSSLLAVLKEHHF